MLSSNSLIIVFSPLGFHISTAEIYSKTLGKLRVSWNLDLKPGSLTGCMPEDAPGPLPTTKDLSLPTPFSMHEKAFRRLLSHDILPAAPLQNSVMDRLCHHHSSIHEGNSWHRRMILCTFEPNKQSFIIFPVASDQSMWIAFEITDGLTRDQLVCLSPSPSIRLTIHVIGATC